MSGDRPRSDMNSICSLDETFTCGEACEQVVELEREVDLLAAMMGELTFARLR